MTSLRSPLQGLAAHVLLPLVLLGAWTTPAARGQVFPVVLDTPVKLTSASSATGDQFSGAIAAGSDILVIGAPLDSTTRGEVTVQEFDGNSFSETATLAPPSLPVGAQFGLALALDDDTLAVGAPDVTFPPNGSGNVYIFIRSGSSWSLEAKLSPSTAQSGDQFGRSLALQGDRLVVGAPFDDDNGLQSGSAWVFERSGTTWSEAAQLLPSDPTSGSQFGRSVALDGSSLLVGAWLDSAVAFQAGAGYVFVESGGSWSEQAKLIAGTAAAGDGAGSSVGLEGDVALLGAPLANNAAGTIFRFDRDMSGVWAEATFFTPFSITSGDAFATSLALRDGTLLVGAPFEDSTGSPKGTVLFYVADEQGVFSVDTEFDSPGPIGDGYGEAVAIGDGFLAIGAPVADGGATDSGAAFAIEKVLIGIWTDKGKSLDGSKGAVQLVGTGTLLEGEPFSLDLSNGLENSLSALIIGFSEVCVPFHLGVLSPSPDFFLIVTTDGNGAQQLADNWPVGHGGPFPVYLHWWVQDPLALAGWSASNALEALTPPG